jgi:hypothetical protein
MSVSVPHTDEELEPEAEDYSDSEPDSPVSELTPQKQAWLDQALFEAASAGDLKGAMRLVRKRANVAFQEALEGVTPLMKAAEAGHTDIVAMLLEEGVRGEHNITAECPLPGAEKICRPSCTVS